MATVSTVATVKDVRETEKGLFKDDLATLSMECSTYVRIGATYPSALPI